MDIATSRDGAVATVAVSGIIDTRAASDFEAALTAVRAEGAKHLIIDLQQVELLTSAGIRVLVAATRRATGTGGSVVLCCLNAGVRRVFDISGLTNQFKIAATREEAQSAISSGAAQPPSRRSRLTLVVGTLLGDGAAPPPPPRGAPPSASPLASRLSHLLDDPIPEARK
jgi:anti-sigma B factor antagonist